MNCITSEGDPIRDILCSRELEAGWMAMSDSSARGFKSGGLMFRAETEEMRFTEVKHGGRCNSLN